MKWKFLLWIFLLLVPKSHFFSPFFSPKRMKSVSEAVEQLLVAAQRQGALTVGVYESAKLMNV